MNRIADSAPLLFRLIPETIGIVESYLFSQQDRFQFRAFGGKLGIIGQVDLLGFRLKSRQRDHRRVVVLAKEFVWIFVQIEQLRFLPSSLFASSAAPGIRHTVRPVMIMVREGRHTAPDQAPI